jgi:hypothetical protein
MQRDQTSVNINSIIDLQNYYNQDKYVYQDHLMNGKKNIN